MKELNDNELEKLIDKTMKMAVLESPTEDFTSSVMSKVENISLNKSISYEPLISKKTWIFICVTVSALYGYVGLQVAPSAWFEAIDFSILYQNKIIETLTSIEISKTTFYAVTLSALLLLIQIPILKYYFDKRISVQS